MWNVPIYWDVVLTHSTNSKSIYDTCHKISGFFHYGFLYLGCYKINDGCQ
jgi:hypothetical protein